MMIFILAGCQGPKISEKTYEKRIEKPDSMKEQFLKPWKKEI